MLSHMPGPTAGGGTSTASLSLPCHPAIANRLAYATPSAATGSSSPCTASTAPAPGRARAPSATAGALANAVAELAQLVTIGRARHRCDVHFGLEVTRVLAAAEAALGLPAVELRYRGRGTRPSQAGHREPSRGLD